MIDSYGIKSTFRIIGLLGGASGLVYWFINMCFFGNRRCCNKESDTDTSDETEKKEKVSQITEDISKVVEHQTVVMPVSDGIENKAFNKEM